MSQLTDNNISEEKCYKASKYDMYIVLYRDKEKIHSEIVLIIY